MARQGRVAGCPYNQRTSGEFSLISLGTRNLGQAITTVAAGIKPYGLILFLLGPS